MARLDELFNADGTERVYSAQPGPTSALTPAVIAQAVHHFESIAPPPLGQEPFQFLSGPAGTGKTWLARELAQSRSDATLCATTGIAAVNLGDAVTINSLLGYFDTQSLMSAFASGWLSTRLRQLRKAGLRLLILDEVSMLDANALTTLVAAFNDVNLTKSYDAELEQVTIASDDTRELRLLLVGDFAQLPPVKAPFAFTSPEWGRFAAHTIKLDTIRRQGDQQFVQALQAIRKGRAQEAVPILEPRFAQVLDFAFPGTTIVAQNSEVDRINHLRLAQLAGEAISWPTLRSGEQQKDWLRLIPEAFTAKVGALVMILANKSYGWDEEQNALGYAYVNGDLGTVLQKEEQGIRVKLHRNQEEVLVTPLTSEWKEPTGLRKPPYTVKGAVTRMPLRLAWATTVHKCVIGDALIPVIGKGYLPIEEVQEGDHTPYGPILAVSSTEQDAYRVVTKRGYVMVCSTDHRWLTRRGWQRTVDLSTEDFIALNPGTPFPGCSTLSWTQAWVLGALVGDGCYTDRDDGTVEFSCSHQVFGELFLGRAQEAFGVSPKWRTDRRGLNWTKKAVRQQWEQWGLDYLRAPAKEIPWIIWRQGPIERGAFLSGLFDTDGHVGGQRLVLTTASETLAAEVQEMLLTLGVVSKRSSYPGVQESTYWQVYIAAEDRDQFLHWVGFTHPEKRERAASHRPNRVLRPAHGYDRIVMVRPMGFRVRMYDVEVARPHVLSFGPFLGHNSQGLTLDQVQVGIANWMFSQPSMIYVALSRCRTLGGLRVVGNAKQLIARCKTDPQIRAFL